MLFYMNSKVFQRVFLLSETEKTILKTQYVIVSTRIRLSSSRTEMKNVISAAALFPGNSVFSAITPEDAEDNYYEQLSENDGLLCSLVKLSIKKGMNIVFINTKSESKLKYLKWLSEYIYFTFGYPVYNYKTYEDGSASLIEYDEEKVLKKCNHRLKEIKEESHFKQLNSVKGREIIKKSFSKMSKKRLIKELKKRDLYSDKFTREQMVEMLELFLDD